MHLNAQPRDQESRAPVTEPAERPRSLGVLTTILCSFLDYSPCPTCSPKQMDKEQRLTQVILFNFSIKGQNKKKILLLLKPFSKLYLP